jgi:hypothetical protein
MMEDKTTGVLPIILSLMILTNSAFSGTLGKPNRAAAVVTGLLASTRRDFRTFM